MDNEFDVNDIVSQIKNQSKSLKKVDKVYPELKKEDLEQFVIDNASKVIVDSVDMIQELKDDVVASGDGKTIEAVSELVKAVTGAIDALSKLKLSDDRIKAQKEIKEMDIASRQIEDKNSPLSIGISISREELLKHLNPFKKDKVNEPTVIEMDV